MLGIRIRSFPRNEDASKKSILEILNAISKRWPQLEKIHLGIGYCPPLRQSDINQMISLFKHAKDIKFKGLIIIQDDAVNLLQASLSISTMVKRFKVTGKDIGLHDIVWPLQAFSQLESLKFDCEINEESLGILSDQLPKIIMKAGGINLKSLKLDVRINSDESWEEKSRNRKFGDRLRQSLIETLRLLLPHLPQLKRLLLNVNRGFKCQDQLKQLCSIVNQNSHLEHLSLSCCENNICFKLSDFEPVLSSLKRLELDQVELIPDSVAHLNKNLELCRLRIIYVPDGWNKESIKSLFTSIKEINPDFLLIIMFVCKSRNITE
jgi:hypothetical protein